MSSPKERKGLNSVSRLGLNQLECYFQFPVSSNAFKKTNVREMYMPSICGSQQINFSPLSSSTIKSVQLDKIILSHKQKEDHYPQILYGVDVYKSICCFT